MSQSIDKDIVKSEEKIILHIICENFAMFVSYDPTMLHQVDFNVELSSSVIFVSILLNAVMPFTFFGQMNSKKYSRSEDCFHHII